MSTMTARVVHLSIDCDWKTVYGFAADPRNMPLWASGPTPKLEPDGDGWIARGILNKVRLSFAGDNDLGVLDHRVFMESGLAVYNAFRVTPNGDGCEVMFTLLKLPEMSDEQFEEDAEHVARDLATLKSILER